MLLIAALLQSIVTIAPVRAEEQRAITALDRAAEGQMLARRFLCGEETRLRRLQELDRRFSGMRRLYGVTFGRPWRQNGGIEASDRFDELGRRDDCRLRDSFFAGLTDYENALFAAQAQLGTPSY